MGSPEHFKLFGFTHLATIAVIFTLACVLTGIARNKKLQPWVNPVSAILAVILLSNEIIWWIVAINLKFWSLRWGLPLQICDLVIFATAYSLMRHRQWVWDLAYFWGLGGTLQAVLTPDMSFTFPHYYFFKFFITHGGVVIAVIFLAAGRGRPIDHFSVWRVFGITNIYAILAGIFNGVTGANYLYLCQKPAHPSILDHLGPWPWYLLGLEAALIISLYFYYLPFFVMAKLKRHDCDGADHFFQ